MYETFRIAIGPGSCRGQVFHGVRAKVAALIEERLGHLSASGTEALLALPLESHQAVQLNGRSVELSVFAEAVPEGHLIVVRAFLHTWRWPTFLSLSAVGHVFAEGLLVTPAGTVVPAPDTLLWSYR